MTAETWNTLHYRSPEHQTAQMEAALEHAGDLRGKALVDVGCGYGDLIRHLPPGVGYIGVEINPDRLERCRALWPDYKFVAADEPYVGDVVVAVATLQCVSDYRAELDSWLAAARERLVVVTLKPTRYGPTGCWTGINKTVFDPSPSQDWEVHVIVK